MMKGNDRKNSRIGTLQVNSVNSTARYSSLNARDSQCHVQQSFGNLAASCAARYTSCAARHSLCTVRYCLRVPSFHRFPAAENMDEIGSPALLVVAEREDHGRKGYATPHAIVSMNKNQEGVGIRLPHLYINRSNKMRKGSQTAKPHTISA